jgi:hypothetical protein
MVKNQLIPVVGDEKSYASKNRFEPQYRSSGSGYRSNSDFGSDCKRGIHSAEQVSAYAHSATTRLR